MTTEDVQRRVSALVKALDIPLGVHAHNNLAMAVSNSIAAYQEGAANLDGTSAGLGAGAGNCPTEILAAVSNKYGIEDRCRCPEADGRGRGSRAADHASATSDRPCRTHSGLRRGLWIVPIAFPRKQRSVTPSPRRRSSWNWGAAK